MGGWAKTVAGVGVLQPRPVGSLLSAATATMTLRSATKTLLVLALGLPVVQAVLTWVRGLLAAMGDEAGAAILGAVTIVCQIVWLITLVALLITLALVVVTERPLKNKNNTHP